MEKMINLKDLLKHEVLDLYSAEEQIIEAMPAMIEKAKDQTLKKTLREHLKITEQQKTRLDKVKELLMEEGDNEQESGSESKGFFSKLFGGSGGTQKCLGIEGLIDEGEKVMSEDMSPQVLDAAIIASAQKIEHYEICGYGTARAYARELNLGSVAELLEETLDEEYEADDLLTDLAVGRLNEQAEAGRSSGRRGGNTSGNGSQKSNGSSSRSSNGSGSSSSAKSKSSGNKSSSGGKGSKGNKSSGGGAKKSSSGAKKSAGKGSGSKKAAGKKSSGGKSARRR